MSKENIYPCVADRPVMVTFFASLPADPERDRLTDAYRRMVAGHIDAGARAILFTSRIAEITSKLVDAEGKARTDLLNEYQALGTELDLLPKLRVEHARRFAQALDSWARYVRPQAVREANGQTDQINRIVKEIDPHGKIVFRLDQSTGARDANLTSYNAAKAEITRLQGEVRPYRVRLQEADKAIGFIDAAISNHFGDAARQHGARQSDIDRFVGRIAKLAA